MWEIVLQAYLTMLVFQLPGDKEEIQMSLPTGPISCSTSYFKIRITTTTPNQTFTLPIKNYYNYNFYVNWGDGSADSHITVWNVNSVHTYAVAGTYIVSMYGPLCSNFTFANAGDKLLVNAIIDVADLGFTNLDFNGCVNLTSIPSTFNRLSRLTSAVNMFAGCTGLTSIPSGIFDSATLITTFFQTFNGCTGITTIPANLFRYNIKATTFAQCFANNPNLTTIPADLFKTNTLVTTFSWVFGVGSGTSKLVNIPTDLFRYNTLANTLDYVFYNCKAITSLPVDIFRYNTACTSFYNTFNGCIGLLTVPTNLFKYNLLATDFRGTFNACTKLQLNDSIFYGAGEQGTRFLNKSVNFTSCFARSSFIGTQGVGPDLWNCSFGTGTPTTSLCYGGAGNSISSLSNYASIPVAWRT